MRLVRLGYWRDDRTEGWPDPRHFVDPTWDAVERDTVADYLRRGLVARAYLGESPCRLCGERVGSLELTDGLFLWPEGLAHYLAVHEVRPPASFVSHVLARQEEFETADLDDDWWRGQGSSD